MNKIKTLNCYIPGKVYLIEIDGKKYIMKKIPLIDRFIKNKPDYNMLVWREIDLSLFINNLPKEKIKFFMKMIDYKEVKCKGIFQGLSKDNSFISKKTNKCLEIIYEYKGDTLRNLLFEQSIKLKEKYSMIAQIIYALDIIKKEGYIHNDVHSGNITYNKYESKIKLGNIKLNNLSSKDLRSQHNKDNYIYSLIDYGFNKHKKYKSGLIKEYLSINWDLIYFLRQIILQTDVLQDKYSKNKIIRDENPKFKMEDIFEIFNNYRKVWNKIKNTLSKKGNNYIKWFETFESGKISKFYKNFDEDFPEMKLNGKNIINLSITEEIKILFSAYDRKNFLKLFKWNKVNIPNLIPSKDIEFMILNIHNNKKIINYFLKKIE